MLKTFKSIVLSSLFLSSFLLSTSLVLADAFSIKAQDGLNELSLAPGSQVSFHAIIANRDEIENTYNIKVGEVSGGEKFLQMPAAWVDLSVDTVTLEAMKEIPVELAFNIPESAEDGRYAISLGVSLLDDTNKTEAGAGTSIKITTAQGVKFFVNVDSTLPMVKAEDEKQANQGNEEEGTMWYVYALGGVGILFLFLIIYFAIKRNKI